MVRISPSWLLAGPTVQPTSGLGHAEFRILRHWMVRDMTIDYSWIPLLFVSNQIKEVSRIIFPLNQFWNGSKLLSTKLAKHHHQPLLSVATWLKKRTSNCQGLKTGPARLRLTERWRHCDIFGVKLGDWEANCCFSLAVHEGTTLTPCRARLYPFFLKGNHQRGLTWFNYKEQVWWPSSDFLNRC